MKHTESKPPRLAIVFFRWYCHPDFREEIEGDLTERFLTYAKKRGMKKARWFFIKEVLLLFRPTIIGNIYHLTNKNSTIMTTQNKRLVSILAGAATLLLVPLVAMKFTNEVKWSVPDFLVAGILLFGTGLILEFILRKVKNVRYRILFCTTLFIISFLIWAELAVGIFGTAFAGN